MPLSTAIAFNPLTKAADVAAQVLTLSPVAVLIIVRYVMGHYLKIK